MNGEYCVGVDGGNINSCTESEVNSGCLYVQVKLLGRTRRMYFRLYVLSCKLPKVRPNRRATMVVQQIRPTVKNGSRQTCSSFGLYGVPGTSLLGIYLPT